MKRRYQKRGNLLLSKRQKKTSRMKPRTETAKWEVFKTGVVKGRSFSGGEDFSTPLEEKSGKREKKSGGPWHAGPQGSAKARVENNLLLAHGGECGGGGRPGEEYPELVDNRRVGLEKYKENFAGKQDDIA